MNNPLAFNDPSGLDGFNDQSGQDGQNPIYIQGAAISCANAAASEGLYIYADFGCAWSLFKDISALFGGPSFHGSLQPRPNDPTWDGNFGESLGLPTNIPQGNWGLRLNLGLPGDDCEFGPCGGGPQAFGPNEDAAGQAEGALDNWLSGLIFTPWNRPAQRRYFGTRWCGPGGAGNPDGHVDAACHIHNLCFNTAHLDANVNTDFSIHLTLPQAAAAQACNRNLFNAVRQYPNAAGSYPIQKWLMYGDLFGILAPGTAVR